MFQFSHAIAQLQNDFSTYTEKWLRDRLAENSDHYLPTFRAIEKLQIENVGWFGRLWLRNRQHFNDPDQYRKELLAEPVKFPEKIDETFMKELQYAMHVHEIVGKLKKSLKFSSKDKKLGNFHEIFALFLLILHWIFLFSSQLKP